MIFAAPWLLLALAALPLLWWLLRVTPPAPRVQSFPAIRLLAGLRAPETTAARTPWWLLALRIFAAGLVVLGLAGPVLDAGGALPGAGRCCWCWTTAGPARQTGPPASPPPTPPWTAPPVRTARPCC